MELEGEFAVPLQRQDVWLMLNDPDVLRRAIPGCKSLEPTADGYVAKVAVAIGPVKATFAGQVKMAEIDAPNRLALEGTGSSMIAGFAKGTAEMNLVDHAEGTLVRYSAKVEIGGKLAQLGSRLIASTSRKLAGQFFNEIEVIGLERAAAQTPG